MATTLILPPRYTPDTIAVGRAAGRAGWEVERLASWRVPAWLRERDVAMYGEPLFAAMIAEQLEMVLLEPTWDWLPRLPQRYRLREVIATTLGEAKGWKRRAFMKPADDKCFRAGVYASGTELRRALVDETILPNSTPVLIAEPVKWEVEFRCFVLDGRVATMSPYLRDGAMALDEEGGWWADEADESAAVDVAADLLANVEVAVPPAVVIDVGRIAERGWAVIEANPAWGSGIYGCDPDQVLRVVRRACMGRGAVSETDQRWVLERGSQLPERSDSSGDAS
jgi:hypothetical protein